MDFNNFFYLFLIIGPLIQEVRKSCQSLHNNLHLFFPFAKHPTLNNFSSFVLFLPLFSKYMFKCINAQRWAELKS